MTKYKKLTKSAFAIVALSLILVAVLAFGGTYAYFSANTGAKSGNLTMGTLALTLTDGSSEVTVLENITVAQPGQYIVGTKATPKTYTLAMGDTNIASYVRVKITAELTDVTYTENTQGDSSINATNFFSIVAGEGWYLHDGWLYQTAGDNASATVNKLAAEAADPTIDVTVSINPIVGKDGSTFFMGKTGTYTITAQAIQADYLNGTDTQTFTVTDLAAAWDTVVNSTYTAA